jgi:hypothetical protein
MSCTERRELERVRYWQGQLLRSRDFNDIHAVEEQRRWWHNRALHNAYGIHRDPDVAQSFAATLSNDTTFVTVTAGLAYDCYGRELILETDQKVMLPAGVPDNVVFVLLARYRREAPQKPAEHFAAVLCSNQGPVRPEFVELTWERLDSFGFTDGVPLIAVKIASGKGTAVDLPFPLPVSDPLARPQLASGSTVPGNTAWDLWTYTFAGDETVLGVQTTIDTSASGFTDAPCYFAWLQGSVFNPQTRQLAPVLFPSIAEETVDSFVFRIALPSPPTEGFSASSASVSYVTPQAFSSFAHQQNLYVNWVGCQKNASAPVLALLLANPGLFLGLNVARFSTLSLNLKLFTTALDQLNKL